VVRRFPLPIQKNLDGILQFCFQKKREESIDRGERVSIKIRELCMSLSSSQGRKEHRQRQKDIQERIRRAMAKRRFEERWPKRQRQIYVNKKDGKSGTDRKRGKKVLIEGSAFPSR